MRFLTRAMTLIVIMVVLMSANNGVQAAAEKKQKMPRYSVAHETINWFANQTVPNFQKVVNAIVYPFVGPYIATIAAPKAIEMYHLYKKDLDYIGYKPEEVFNYIMDIS